MNLASTEVIGVHDATLTLGGREILAGIDFTIDAGEFIGVLGPNGAGKTTLMRAILGLLSPVRGEIRVFGEPARRGNPLIGYMPQMRGVTPGMTLDGHAFVATVVDGHRWGLPRLSAAARREVDRALALVGATDLARRPLMETSGGERQRLLLAQALIGRPRLLLLDEPLISLDPSRQQEVVDLVRRLQRELGFTVLFTAHELNPLLGALDRVLYLGNRQAALGSVDEVITGEVLSRLYDAEIQVIRVEGRIFVMAGSQTMEAHHHGCGQGEAPCGPAGGLPHSHHHDGSCPTAIPQAPEKRTARTGA